MEAAKKKILIVDDDQFLLSMYASKFTKSGFEVTTVTGSAEALAKIKEGLKADIIMMDLVMPSMSGLELLQAIRKEKFLPDATVVMLTNQGQPADIEQAKKLGVDSYIVKANTIPSEVVEEVAKAAARSRKSA